MAKVSPPANQPGTLLVEALDGVVSGEVRNQLVTRALLLAATDEVPQSYEEFLNFVRGPLAQALSEGLGEALAESVVVELETLASRMTRASRPTPRRGSLARRSLSPAPPTRRLTPEKPGLRAMTSPPRGSVPLSRVPLVRSSSATGGAWQSDQYAMGAARSLGLITEPPRSSGPPPRPLVLISSADPSTAASFTSLLADRAEVSSVSSFRELVLILEAEAEAKLVLVVDCQHPALRATAVAALADELSARVTVILWRSAPATYQAVLATSPSAQRFVACAESAGTEAVVERCRKIVG